MKQSLLLFLLVLPFFISESAQAAGSGKSGFFFDETFIPVYVNSNDTTSYNTAPGVATTSGTGFDFRTTIGYIFGGNYVVGLTYNTYSLSTTRAAVAGGDEGLTEKTQRSEYGPTIGYTNNGWRVLVSYFVSGSKQVDRKNVDSSGVTTGDISFKNTDLSGFQLNLGYTFALSANFEIGPSLVYKTLTYASQSKTNVLTPAEDYASTSLYTKSVDDSLSPMISMQLRF